MAKEIYIQSNSRIRKIQEDIDEVLDRCNIKLSIFSGDKEIENYDSKLKSHVDSEEYSFGSMEFAKNMQVDNFEQNFEERYGLRIELKRPDGSQAPDGWTLSDYEDAFKVKQNVLEDPITEWLTKTLFDGNRPDVGQIEDELEKLSKKGDVGEQTLKNIYFNDVEKPREETVKKIAEGLGEEIPEKIQRKYESTAFGFLGDWKEFNPNDKKDWPEKGVSGVYIIYDENEYPIYVGKSADCISSRLKKHSQKKWWVRKILGNSKYVTIKENEYNDHKRMVINDVEKVLIKSLSPIINNKM